MKTLALKQIFLIVTLPALLAACAAPRPSASTSVAAADSAQTQGNSSAANVENQPEEQASEDPLPTLELTEDLMFKLMAAELANQRGDWQTGYVTMLALAQQTRDPRIARRATEIALQAKHADEALNAVRLWRTLAPHSDEANQYYLSFIILSDKLADAKPILDERLKEARPRTRGLMALQLQRLLSRAKDKAAAFSLLEQVLAPYTDLPETHMAVSQGALTVNDAARARQEAATALRMKPDSELAALTLAQATTDKDDATKVMADFLAKHPKAREVRMAYARMLVEQQQYGKARGQFETLLKDQPQDLTTLFALGILNTQLNDMPAAEKYLTDYLQALSAQPDEERDPTQALLLLAQIAEERKDPEAAMKWLAQIEPGEGYLGAQIKRAQLTAKRGDIPAARKLLHEIDTKGEREEVQVMLAEGQMLRDADQLSEAMNVLREGLKHYPSNTDLLYDYAMLAEKRNMLSIMETSLRKIIELAPGNQHAYNALGYSFAERNIRLDEAYGLIDKALKLAPDDPFIMDSMGWVQFRLGRLKEAEASLRRAYELRPDAEIAVHLGEVLWVIGQKADAQKLWRDAQTKDPQNDTLKNTLARLNVQL